MENVEDIKLIYGEIELPPGIGYRCPKCKVEYLDGETTVNELNPAEEMLQGK
jgi:hypothetical protein